MRRYHRRDLGGDSMPAASRGKQPAVQPDNDLPLEERVRRRAHELFVERSHQPGSGVEDWLQAEDEIQSMEEQKKRYA